MELKLRHEVRNLNADLNVDQAATLRDSLSRVSNEIRVNWKTSPRHGDTEPAAVTRIEQSEVLIVHLQSVQSVSVTVAQPGACALRIDPHEHQRATIILSFQIWEVTETKKLKTKS